MSSKRETLIELQKEWYAKLKASGFEDQERFSKNMKPKHTLKQESRTLALYHSPNASQIEQYYIDCRAHMHKTHLFASEVDYSIWGLYSEEGLSIQKICRKLNLPFEQVRRVVKYHRETYILPLYKPAKCKIIKLTTTKENNQNDKD